MIQKMTDFRVIRHSVPLSCQEAPMKRSAINPCVFAILAAFAANDAVASDRICEQTDLQSHNYYRASWPIWAPPNDDDGYCRLSEPSAPDLSELLIWLPEPPPSPRLICEQVANCTHSCSLYPFGSGFTFEWKRISGLVSFDPVPQPGDNFATAKLVNNLSATIEGTVISAAGARSNPIRWTIPAGTCFQY
jgi:hypothetical protein